MSTQNTTKVYQVRGGEIAANGYRLERLFYTAGGKTFATSWDDYSEAVNTDSLGRARQWDEVEAIPAEANFIGNYMVKNLK